MRITDNWVKSWVSYHYETPLGQSWVSGHQDALRIARRPHIFLTGINIVMISRTGYNFTHAKRNPGTSSLNTPLL